MMPNQILFSSEDSLHKELVVNGFRFRDTTRLLRELFKSRKKLNLVLLDTRRIDEKLNSNSSKKIIKESKSDPSMLVSNTQKSECSSGGEVAFWIDPERPGLDTIGIYTKKPKWWSFDKTCLVKGSLGRVITDPSPRWDSDFAIVRQNATSNEEAIYLASLLLIDSRTTVQGLVIINQPGYNHLKKFMSQSDIWDHIRFCLDERDVDQESYYYFRGNDLVKL